VKDLLAQTEKDAAQAHSIVVSSDIPPSPVHGFQVSEIAKLYNFPSELDGQGQTIAFIELGGGYQDSDLDAYFTMLKLKKPNVTSVSISGASNNPKPDNRQATIDIEMAGAVAPGARMVVYLAPNTTLGFLQAVDRAINDRPSIIMTSWGAPETFWSDVTLSGFEEAFTRGALLAITMIAAAGDDGVTEILRDGKAHVDFPASSPYVLAVGGSRLNESRGTIGYEVVWNGSGGATGGGVSDHFPLPSWQNNAGVPPRADGGLGRGIPDVVANADPATGYFVILDGTATTTGGTAAAAALWAGLIALLNQGVGHNLGYINPMLYQKIGPSGVLRRIDSGDNSHNGVKGYSAGPGWSAAAGWGSPDGRKLLAALRQMN
jgi:kumamolisin